jgi:hypothetical protein
VTGQQHASRRKISMRVLFAGSYGYSPEVTDMRGLISEDGINEKSCKPAHLNFHEYGLK